MMRILLFLLAATLAAPASANEIMFNCLYERFCAAEKCDAADFRLEFNVDKYGKSATMTGNNGVTQVAPFIGMQGISFVESLNSGAIQTTTVNFGGASVHSRHSMMQGKLVASQYYGECAVHEK